MIQSFADESTAQLWRGQKPPKLPPDILKVALRKLTQLEAATSLEELRFPPGKRLELLKGDRAGHYSIRVNDKYRVCFKWEAPNASAVEIVDYH